MDSVQDFLGRYRKEYDFFEQAGRLAAQILEGRLKAAGIRSIVTSRAKGVDRLESKVQERTLRKSYVSAGQIFDDIVDLAGVRVALYFPGESVQVENIVNAIFDLEAEPKRFPDPAVKPAYDKRFSGYVATHYRVRLKPIVLSEAQKRYADARIEIQVASVLMHSWAEVEHDLVYKPQQGRLSEEEYDILDELNGLVLAGEISLKRLQKAGEARVAAGTRSFSNHYDLAAHLLGTAVWAVGGAIKETALGRVDLLFDFLKELSLATPNQLKQYLEHLTPDLEKLPLAEQIIDQLLSEDDRRYSLYERLRTTRPVPGDPLAKRRGDGFAETSEEVTEFLSNWVRLEQIIKQNAEKADESHIYPSSKLLARLGIADEVLLKDFDRIRRMRNEIVHGLSIPPREDLQKAATRIDEISLVLNSSV